MFIAQVNATLIGNWILAAGVIVSLVGSCVAIFSNLKRQKREVTFGDQYVTKYLCDSLHAATARRVDKIESDIAAMREELKADRANATHMVLDEVGKVHNRVNLVLEGVAVLRGKIDSLRK